MPEYLTEPETRILGALVEKQLTTPEYYPLTMNALIAACNQKTNREPVVNYDEPTVMRFLDKLRGKNLVYIFHGSSSRVPKYKHALPSVYELEPSETAVICVLLLRGAQTIGELRERTSRLYDFHDLNDVNETLEALINRDEPLIVKLERQPGQKEARYAHLLSGVPDIPVFTPKTPTANADNERIEKLEQEVETLKNEFDAFRQLFEEFKKQFE